MATRKKAAPRKAASTKTKSAAEVVAESKELNDDMLALTELTEVAKTQAHAERDPLKISEAEEIALYGEFGGDYECTSDNTIAMGADTRQAVNLPRFSLLFWKGSVVYRPTREAEFRFSFRESDIRSRDEALRVMDLERRGWTLCKADEFWVHPEYRTVLKPNSEGVLSINGGDTNTLLLMSMPKDRAEELKRYNRRFSEDVGQSFADRMADSADRLESIGARTIVESTVDTPGAGSSVMDRIRNTARR